MKNKVFSYQTIVFALLTTIIFFKCIVFHCQCYNNPLGFPSAIEAIAFYLSKLSIAIFLASCTFIFKQQWWSIILLLCIDTWCLANYIYFQANSLFLNLDAIRMANNLHGFEKSIIHYLNFEAFTYIISTVFYVIFIGVIKKYTNIVQRAPFLFIISLTIGILFSITGGLLQFKNKHKNEEDIKFNAEYLNPFITPTELEEEEWLKEKQNFNYVARHSIIMYFGNMIYEGRKMDNIRQQDVEYTDEEQSILSQAVGTNKNDTIVPKYNLIVVMVESFESWTLEVKDVYGNSATPNLLQLMKQRPTLYCHNMVSQTKHGVSGDGQMIVHTGLLPIQSGAACIIYGNNTYPGFVHLYPQSCLINPTTNAWNQKTMSKNYGYKAQISPSDNKWTNTTESWEDSITFNNAISSIKQIDPTTPFCSFIITMSSHSPFWLYDKNYNLNLNEYWSESAINYIGSIHYMDNFIGKLINYMDSTQMFDNTILLITGDHIIFREQSINELWGEGAKHDNISVANERNYIPLIITGAGITENKIIEEDVYQMDVYPTIMNLINAKKYYWHGLGVDLSSDYSRPLSVRTTEILSDKLIRDNYFAK